MTVFVLMKSDQVQPVCVVSDPKKVHAPSERVPKGYGGGHLPDDAVPVVQRPDIPLSCWKDGDIAGAWDCPKVGAAFMLVACSVV